MLSVVDAVNLRTSLFALFAVSALTGATVFHCSSGSGTFGAKSKSSSSKNRKPTATNSGMSTQRNVTVSRFMQASDPDGDALVYSLVADPSLGVINVTDASTGAYTYVSSASGSDSFSFKANDGQADSNVATVSITVNEVEVSWEAVTGIHSSKDQESAEVECLHGSGPVPASADQGARSRYKPTASASFDVVADPFDSSHLLRSGDNCNLKRSTDGGLTWYAVGIDPLVTTRCHYALIHFNVFQPGLVYLGINETGGGGRLLRSTEGGVYWELISTQLPGRFETLRSCEPGTNGDIRLIVKFDHDAKSYKGTDRPFGNGTAD